MSYLATPMLSRDHPARICGGLAVRLFRFGCNCLRLWRFRRAGLHCPGMSYIHRGARLSQPANVTIGANCYIGRAFLYSLNAISIGERSIVGDDVYLCTGSHDINSAHFELVTKPIAIGSSVWIATGATILPGVTIGDGAVVGAMAVVSRDVPAGGVAAGNPARIVKTGRPLPAGFDPLSLAPMDYRRSMARLRCRVLNCDGDGAPTREQPAERIHEHV